MSAAEQCGERREEPPNPEAPREAWRVLCPWCPGTALRPPSLWSIGCVDDLLA